MHLDFSYADRLAELTLIARIGWTIAALSVAVFAYLLIRVAAHYSTDPGVTPADRLRTLHQSNGATASMEYLMVLFPFLIIVMTVWQLAFMLNGQLHVGYSVFAAARSASVMIPAEMECTSRNLTEEEGELKKNCKKWERIHNAAIPGTIAISPGHGPTALAVGALNGKAVLPKSLAAMTSRLTLMSAHHPPGVFSGNRVQRTLVKNAYAETMTEVLINGQDRKQDQTLTGGQLATVVDSITVTVKYEMWLQVPYVGRILAGSFLQLNPYPSTELSETIVISAWPRRRAIKPCN